MSVDLCASAAAVFRGAVQAGPDVLRIVRALLSRPGVPQRVVVPAGRSALDGDAELRPPGPGGCLVDAGQRLKGFRGVLGEVRRHVDPPHAFRGQSRP